MAPATRPAACRARRGGSVLALAAVAAVAFLGLRPLFITFGASSTPKAEETRQAAPRREMLLGVLTGGLFNTIIPTEEAQALGTDRRIALPPIKRIDKARCQWITSKMGQANAQRDKLFDLRECKMAGTSAADKDIAGVIMNSGDFTNVSFENTVMSKAIAENANFENAVFRNAVVDRVTFINSTLKGAIFDNAVLTGSDFAGTNLENSDFTDAKIDMFGIKPLCQNPTMKGKNPVTGVDTYDSAGCYNQGLAR